MLVMIVRRIYYSRISKPPYQREELTLPTGEIVYVKMRIMEYSE